MNTIRAERARHGHGHGDNTARNWKIVDSSGPKVFTRVLVYSYWQAAVLNAHRLANRERISTHGLLSVHTERQTS